MKTKEMDDIGLSKAYDGDLVGVSRFLGFLRTGKVSATLASTVTRESGGGEAATKTLTEAVETAKAAGKGRATRKHLPRPAKPPAAPKDDRPALSMALVVKLASLAVHVEEFLSVDGHPSHG